MSKIQGLGKIQDTVTSIYHNSIRLYSQEQDKIWYQVSLVSNEMINV